MQERIDSTRASSGGGAPEWRDEDAYGLPRANFPGSGLVVLAGVILLGLIPSAYYMWARPRMEKSYAQELVEAPTTAHGRLEKWFEFGSAMIHHRLTKVGRFSDDYPWVVTHAVRREGDLAQAFGLDVSALGADISRLEGMTVIVELPAPTSLGPLPMRGERARYVPLFDTEEEVPDPVRRLGELALWFLEDLPQALGEDIEGASLELLIGGQVVIPRVAAADMNSPRAELSSPKSIQPSAPDGR